MHAATHGACCCARGFRSLLGGGIASIGRLERLLSQTLNGGEAICWCAVRRGKEDFRYALTREKKIRLAATLA